MQISPARAEVKPNSGPAKFKANLGAFDYDRIAREMGGLIPWQDIGEILNATKNRPELIDYLLGRWVKNRRQILRNYTGTYCQLLDYHVLPGVEYPLYVSRVNGSVLPESWGERRERGKPPKINSNIFDVAEIIFFGLQEKKKNFPKVYRIVREGYEAFKRRTPPTEESNRKNALVIVRYRKELLFPYFRPFFSTSIRKAPKYPALWRALPLEIKQEFGGSVLTFRDFLRYLDREDRTEEPFRIIEHRYGNKNGSRFQLIGDGEKYIPAPT